MCSAVPKWARTIFQSRQPAVRCSVHILQSAPDSASCPNVVVILGEHPEIQKLMQQCCFAPPTPWRHRWNMWRLISCHQIHNYVLDIVVMQYPQHSVCLETLLANSCCVVWCVALGIEGHSTQEHNLLQSVLKSLGTLLDYWKKWS